MTVTVLVVQSVEVEGIATVAVSVTRMVVSDACEVIVRVASLAAQMHEQADE